MTIRKGEWTFSFIVDKNGRVLVNLLESDFEGISEYDIDTFLIEGAYEIVKNSEKIALSITMLRTHQS